MAGDLWEQGMRPEAAVMTLSTARKLADETLLWGYYLDPPTVAKIPGAFGTIEIMTSKYCPADSIYVCSKEQALQMISDTEEKYAARQEPTAD